MSLRWAAAWDAAGQTLASNKAASNNFPARPLPSPAAAIWRRIGAENQSEGMPDQKRRRVSLPQRHRLTDAHHPARQRAANNDLLGASVALSGDGERPSWARQTRAPQKPTRAGYVGVRAGSNRYAQQANSSPACREQRQPGQVGVAVSRWHADPGRQPDVNVSTVLERRSRLSLRST